jgi:hypothetical protein
MKFCYYQLLKYLLSLLIMYSAFPSTTKSTIEFKNHLSCTEVGVIFVSFYRTCDVRETGPVLTKLGSVRTDQDRK